MADQGPEWQRRIAAADSAHRLLDELGVDPTRRIDVFGLCEDLGLWLVFLPLDNLLGAYIPEGAGGVMITTERPVTVQRYTAAHELGHWRMDHGHGIALDGAEHILGRSPIERERLAQFFAANLLMPPPLIYGVLDRLQLTGAGIKPDHVYAVAREAGVSFEAAARQLRNLEIIHPGELYQLLKLRPISVKAQLALGRRPVNGYADVWPVNEAWNDQVLSLRVEDEIVVSLPENRTTGYRWMLSGELPDSPLVEPIPPFAETSDLESSVQGPTEEFQDFDATAVDRGAPRNALSNRSTVSSAVELSSELTNVHGIEVVGDDYVSSRGAVRRPPQRRSRRLELVASFAGGANLASAKVGATGRRVIGLRFPMPGASTLTLEYRSPYDGAPAIGHYVLHALVEARHLRFSVDQIARDSDDAWTDAARAREVTRAPNPLADDSGGDTDPSGRSLADGEADR
jgi:hypothetical protein